MAAKSLENLFLEVLKDLYYLEKRSQRALATMAGGASAKEVAALFEKHRAQADGQRARLEKIFAILGERPETRPWPAIDGIIDEGPEIVSHYAASTALDAGLLAAAQTVKHYEMTRYGILKRWAEVLGKTDTARLLGETLREESQANDDLSVLAELTLSAHPLKTLLLELATAAALLPEAA